MIDPKLSQQRRFGIQGGVSFDPKTANVPLYKSIETFLKGAQGLGGSGGALANAPKLDAGFQQSHVFNNMSMRQQVQDRLEKQLTEHLQNLVGEQAAAQNMSIPSFLQSQGIRGISETKTGNLSAYKTDNFLKTSFNPIASSTERMAKASMKMSGAIPTVSGGSNEHRRLSAYLRAPEARHIVNMVQQTADEVSSGTYNKGPMEGLYASAGDRADARSRQKTIQNMAGTFDLENRSPSALEEAKSMMLKQQAKKDLYSSAKQELIASGELPDDKPAEKERKTSPASAAAKGMMAVVSRIGTTLSTVKNLVGSMIGLLKTIAMQTGRLVMDSANLGIDPQMAKSMQKWGNKNPAYTEGNEFLLLDAIKEFKSKFGDLIRFDKNVNFSSAAFNDYSNLIAPTLKASLQKNPLMGTELIYGAMAERYTSMGSKEGKAKELMKQQTVLTDEFGAVFAQAYVALIKSSESWLTKGNAHNILRESIEEDRLNRLSSGAHINNIIPGVSSSVNIANNTRNVNNVLGDVAMIKDALLMKLLTKIDMLIQVMDMLTLALLTVFKSLGVSGADKALEEFKGGRKQRAEKGYVELRTNTMKYRADAEAGIESYLYKKGLRGDALSSTTSDIFSRMYKGEQLPAAYAGVTGGQRGLEIIAATAAYKTGVETQKNIYSDVAKEGIFRHSGDSMNMLYEAGSEFQSLLSIYNQPNQDLQMSFFDRVGGRKLSKAQRDKLKNNPLDKSAATSVKMDLLPGGLMQTDVVVPEGFSGGGSDANDIETDAAARKAKQQLDDIMKLKGKGGFNLIPLHNLSNKVASVGGSLSGQNNPFVITHNVALTVNGAAVLSKSTTLSADSEKRFLLDNSQARVKV